MKRMRVVLLQLFERLQRLGGAPPVLLLIGTCAFLLWTGCGNDDGGKPEQKEPPTARSAEVDRLRSLPYIDFAESDDVPDDSGVTPGEPDRVSPGYNLAVYQPLSLAELFDNEGRVLRVWEHQPSYRWATCRLLDNGDVVVIGTAAGDREMRVVDDDDRYVLRMSWGGEMRWKHELPAHHDIEPGPNSDLLTLTIEQRDLPAVHPDYPTRDDRITKLSPTGEVLATRSIYDALAGAGERYTFQPMMPKPKPDGFVVDLLHVNSVQWNPYTHLADAHALYDPRNVLICSRHQDVVAAINWDTGELAWSWGQGQIDGPHDARYLEDGHILLFDNGLARGWSRVIELAPLTGQIVWQYQATPREDFYTRSWGACQRLPNGNTLITESGKGHAFEVTPAGEIVWDFWGTRTNDEGKRAVIVQVRRYPPEYVERWLDL